MSASAPPETSAPGSKPALDARDERLRRIYGAVLLSALLSFCSFHPVDLGILAWVALVPALYVAATEGRWVGVVVAYTFTVLYHIVGLSWIALTTPEGWLTTSFMQGAYGIALICGPLWIRRKTKLPLVLILPLVGVALEWMRGNFPFIAFPWLLWGQSQHARTTLIQIADIASVYGVSALVLSVNGLVIEVVLLVEGYWKAKQDLSPAVHRRIRRLAAGPLIAIVVALLYGVARSAHVRSATEDGPRLLVVQIDVPQNLKEEGGIGAQTVASENLGLTLAALNRSREKFDAIVWSETVWLFPIRDERKAAGRVQWDDYVDGFQRDSRPSVRRWIRSWMALNNQLYQLVDRTQVPLLVGALDRGWVDGGGEHNSFYMLVPDPPNRAKVQARYDKINLVPVSEYIPFKGTPFYSLLKSFVPPGFTVFEQGRKDQPLFEFGEHKLAPNICFEISFPELLRSFTARGATVHVCPANDAWFVRGARGQAAKATAEVALSQAHTKFRAIENRRGVVRCVNRGISLVMDPAGEVSQRVERLDDKGEPRVIGVANTMHATVPTTSLRSFYVRFGNVFAWLCVLGALFLIGCAWKGKRFGEEDSEGITGTET